MSVSEQTFAEKAARTATLNDVVVGCLCIAILIAVMALAIVGTRPSLDGVENPLAPTSIVVKYDPVTAMLNLKIANMLEQLVGQMDGNIVTQLMFIADAERAQADALMDISDANTRASKAIGVGPPTRQTVTKPNGEIVVTVE